MKFSTYDPGEFYDELFEGLGRPRRGSALLLRKFASLADGELRKRQQAAERVILNNMGMTFGVYGSDGGQEHTFRSTSFRGSSPHRIGATSSPAFNSASAH